MKRKTINYPVAVLKFNLSMLVFTRWSVIIILSILTKGALGQGCSVTLKINDPSPVCSPSTVDLTSAAVTSGSTRGMVFSYYMNPELTIKVPSPTKVNSGTYYIKGVTSGHCAGFAVAVAKATVLEKPKVVVPNPVISRGSGTIDLTLPQITTGSDVGLIFTYWTNFELTKPVISPQSTANGIYYIKGTSANGCSDIQSININD